MARREGGGREGGHRTKESLSVDRIGKQSVSDQSECTRIRCFLSVRAAPSWESDQYFRVDIRLVEQIYTLPSTLYIRCRARRNDHRCTSIVSIRTLVALFSSPTLIYLPLILSFLPPPLLGHCWMSPWFLTVSRKKNISSNFFSQFSCMYIILRLTSCAIDKTNINFVLYETLRVYRMIEWVIGAIIGAISLY